MPKPVVWVVPLLLVAAVGIGGWAWMRAEAQRLPPGIAAANGRMEVERWDVATKLPGRVAEIRVKEGDMVAKGDVVARMDVADLLAQKAAASANVGRAAQGIVKAHTDVVSAEANLALAEVEQIGRAHV